MREQQKAGSAESLGARVKRLRKARGLSQDRLAIEARVDQSGLSRFERGKTRRLSDVSLLRVAHVLGISFEELTAATDHSD